MNYGQVSMASMPIVTQLVTPDQTVQVTTAVEGLPQNVDGFADLLSSIQQSAKGKGLGEPGQTEALPLDIGTENPAVDLLALLGVSPQIMTVAEPAVSKSDEEPQKTVVSTDVEHVGNADSAMALQMAMAAYVQPGRTPEVSIPAQLSFETLQNVATVTEQTAAITASTAASVEPQIVPVIVQAAPTAVTPDAPRAEEVNKSAPLSVDKLQNVAIKTEQPAAITASTATAVLPQTTQDIVQAAPTIAAPDAPARAAEVNKSAPLTVDRIQNVAGEPEQAAAIITSVALQSVPVEVQAAPTVVTPEAPVKKGEVNKLAPISVDRLQNVASTPEQPVAITDSATIQTEQHAAGPLQEAAQRPAMPVVESPDKSESAKEKAQSMASSPDQPSDLELEIQLSQPRPITARDASVSASTVAAVNDSHNIRLRLSSDLQIEKVRSGDEPGSVKEVASTLPMEVSESTSTLDSDDSSSSGNNQGQPESASDNQLLTQQMRGQLSTEHQKISAATKPVAAEPARQELQEQVFQQVKDRLVSHDVKPGNQQITLTLSPENLGEVKMSLNLQGQKLSVEIIAENRTVRDIIVQHTEALKESLARQNITMESFDVTTGGKGSGNQGQNQNAWRELTKQQQQQQLWMSPRGYTAAQADLPSELAMPQRRQRQSMLDIHY
ncbi:MAG: flagellar hook-length control protein FliK [Desulfuromonadaceae bacterium]|nr:flagellar hook-length control protein FliK [Desulfuromonadaceae bacterium]